MNTLQTYIENHLLISSIVAALLYIGYEIAIRKIPTDSPYWSITHTAGKFVKMLGKLVLKVVGENLSKKLEEGKNKKHS